MTIDKPIVTPINYFQRLNSCFFSVIVYKFQIKKTYDQIISSISMVPEVGLEPTWYCYRWILSPLRLPISPPGECSIGILNYKDVKVNYSFGVSLLVSVDSFTSSEIGSDSGIISSSVKLSSTFSDLSLTKIDLISFFVLL